MSKKVCAKSKDETEEDVGECRKLGKEIIIDSSDKFPMKEVKIFDRLSNAKLYDAQQKGKSSAKDDCITTGANLTIYL